MSPDVQSRVPPPKWEVIDRYLSSEATPHEIDTVEVYLSRRPEVALALKRLSSIYAGEDGDTLDVSAAWTTLMESLATVPSANVLTPPTRPRRLFSIAYRRPKWSVALGTLASMLVLVVGWRSCRAMMERDN